MATMEHPATPLPEAGNGDPPLKTPRGNEFSVPTPTTAAMDTPSPTGSPNPDASPISILGYMHERDSHVRFEEEENAVVSKRAPSLSSLVTDCIGQCEKIESRLNGLDRIGTKNSMTIRGRQSESLDPALKKNVETLSPASSDSSVDGMGSYIGHLLYGGASNISSPMLHKSTPRRHGTSTFGAIPTTTDPRVLVEEDDDHSACPFDCVDEYHKDSQAIQHKKWSADPAASREMDDEKILAPVSRQLESTEQEKHDYYKIPMPSRLIQNISSTVKKSILGGIAYDDNNISFSSDLSMASTPFDEIERDIEEQSEFGFEEEASSAGDRLGLEEYSTLNRLKLSKITSLKQHRQLKLQRQLKSFINVEKDVASGPKPDPPSSPPPVMEPKAPCDPKASRLVSGFLSSGRVAMMGKFTKASPPRAKLEVDATGDSPSAISPPKVNALSTSPPLSPLVPTTKLETAWYTSRSVPPDIDELEGPKPTARTGLEVGNEDIDLSPIGTPKTTSSSLPSPAEFDRGLADEKAQSNPEDKKKPSSSGGLRNICKNCLTILIVLILVAAVIVFFTMFAKSKKEEPYTEVVVTETVQDPFGNDVGNTVDTGGGSVPATPIGGGGISGMFELDNPFFNNDDGPNGVPGSPSPGSGTADDNLFNDRCIHANKVLDWEVSGNNIGASWDGTLDKCGAIASPGPGVWFYLEPTQSRLLTASTGCDSSSIPTQVTVFTGTCDELQCVAFHGGSNDNCASNNNRQFGGPSRHEAAVWFAEEGVPYFILVEGYRGAEGKFTLHLEPVESQDSCPATQDLLEQGASVTATTRDATIEDQWVINSACNNFDISTPGVWFRTGGSFQDNLRADVLPIGPSQFRGQITVFSSVDGTCQDLTCEESSYGSVTWRARQDRIYFILVTSRPETDPGDFELKFDVEDAFDLALRNDVCNSAARLITSNVPLFVGSTEYASFSAEVPSCGSEVFATAPGLWFTIVGTGGKLSASTCGSQTQLDTQISVFHGDGCWDLKCVVGNDDDPSCGAGGSTATWFSEDGRVYYIFVSGHGSNTGVFELTVRETLVDHGNECESAPLLESHMDVPIVSTTVEVQTSDSDVSIVERGSYRTCGISSQAQGVWYEFKGTGKTMVASTCHESTNFGAMVSVFWKGCDDRRCVDSVGYSCGGQYQQSMVSWQSKLGESYHVFVHGSYMVDTGEFDLSIGEPPSNEVCGSAMGPLFVDGPTVFGSTHYASIRYDLGSCNAVTNKNDSTTSSSRGVWYYMEAARTETITASACSAYTNFEAELYVFTGDCSSRQCVQTSSIVVSDTCGALSTVSWDARAGVKYLILLRGSGVSEFGNYALSIRS